MVSRFSRGPPGRNNFSYSESLCHSNASHQVLAQSNTVWEKMSSEEFQDGSHDGHLGYQNGTILAILIGLDKGGYPINIFLISPRKHMLWVLIRSASARHF